MENFEQNRPSSQLQQQPVAQSSQLPTASQPRSARPMKKYLILILIIISIILGFIANYLLSLIIFWMGMLLGGYNLLDFQYTHTGLFWSILLFWMPFITLSVIFFLVLKRLWRNK